MTNSVRAGIHPALTRIRYIVIMLLATAALAACSAAPSGTPPADEVLSLEILVPLTDTPVLTESEKVNLLTPVPSESKSGDLPASTPTRQPAVTQFDICSPLGWETISELSEIIADPYHPPPPERAEERHHGVDFSHYARKGHSSILGEPVQAVLPGVVAASVADRLPYGNMVIIETSQANLPDPLVAALGLQSGQSLYLLYAHLENPPHVSIGETITCGQGLGTVGKTGYNIVNEHLHLETRYGPSGAHFTSMAFYTASATEDEMLNYKRWRTGGEFIHFDPMKLFDLWKLAEHGD
ncbi:MAG: M23 family metallopeptidase [Anaerolineales bacterium]|nr:M23 family metallopeptidase [Anaerolineales bacterium]